MTSTQYQKLQRLLRGLFRTDQADLDFGIYRVINQKRDEVNQFLDEDLLPQVQAAFQEYQSVDSQSLNAELQKAIKQAENLGADPDTLPKVKEIKEQIASYGVDVTELENQVYAALYNFFRRYYDKGDFISQRRYKEGVYAIPYEGEEVKLHWANQDQYYIKTSEHLRNYTFKLKSGQLAHVKLVSADTEKDNRKETDDKKRRFILADDPIRKEDGQLVLQFEFRPDTEKRKQEKLNKVAVETIFDLRDELDDPTIKAALTELSTPAPTESDKTRTLLAKHLDDYTRRNTQDYFIHKDLGKFLRQELDFFIKNEIMYLDDVENETAPRVEQYLSKIKVIRKIAHQIIAFLAQIEDFQKKLWLKKKFVVETNYCITLDRIPEDFYPEIMANAAQCEAWIQLFAIDEIKGDLVTPAYSEPLTIEFLKANPFLVLDTKFFDENFKYALVESIENLEESLDGLLIHSENFQALNSLQQTFREKVTSIYIDPPYNTGPSEILYKNEFKDASWLSLMKDRLALGGELLESESAFALAIDDYCLVRLSELLDSLFVNYERNVVIVNHHPQGAGGNNISRTHEYMLYMLPQGKDILRGAKKDVNVEYRSFMLSGPGENKLRTGRPNSFYALIVDAKNKKLMGIEAPPRTDEYPTEKTPDGYERWYPIGSSGRREQVWARSYESAIECFQKNEIIITRNNAVKFAVDVSGKRSLLFSNWVKSKYNAGPHGTQLIREILGDSGIFSYPKSIHLVRDAIESMAWTHKKPIIMDYFAGSGTTAHAVINLNREDNGHRKYILVEMGQYFDTALKPRIQKVIYSENWKDGKPISRQGSSHAFKYLKLESYEDTLNNLELTRSEVQTEAMFSADAFRDDYLLSYMLDIESQGSLLSIKDFETPFDYKLQIATDTVGETVSTKIDLVETFNYLIGLHVEHISRIQGVVVVEGTTRQGEKTLVIWRNVHEMENENLDRFFEKLDIRTRDFEYDVIYVNGDNNLPNLRTPDERWKVRLIEDDFLRLMFDVEGI